MKNIILYLSLFICLANSCQPALAQVKKDTAKVPAPVYTPDMNKKHDLVLPGLSLQQINDYMLFQQRGPAIDTAVDISAHDVRRIETNTQLIWQLFGKRLQLLIDTDKAKWELDNKIKK